jgi:hypothetical protein
LERKDAEFDTAWNLLIAKRHDPAQWMYMHSTPTAHHFKNSVTRAYIVIDKDPKEIPA